MLICVIFSQCAGFSAVFRGNTRKDFGDYDIIERQEYQHYLNERAELARRTDSEALRRITLENERSLKSAGINKSPIQSHGSKSAKTGNPAPKEEKRSFIVRTLRRLLRMKD